MFGFDLPTAIGVLIIPVGLLVGLIVLNRSLKSPLNPRRISNTVRDDRGSVNYNVPKEALTLPKVWIGLIFPPVSFLLAFFVSADKNDSLFLIILFGIALCAGELYWSYCVYKIHKIIEVLTNATYPISPLAGAIKNYVPLYNLYWVYRWPRTFSNFINESGYTKIMSGNFLGNLFVVSMLISVYFGRALGLAMDLIIIIYMANKLHSHIENYNKSTIS